MELGVRIRQARLEAGLSQRQLSDGIVTRNMLSLIESGKARPGMDTLMALAARLGKSSGFFLDREAVLSPNQNIMSEVRRLYTAGNWEAVAQRLADYRSPDEVFDNEKALLEAHCLMALAKAALKRRQTVYARDLLEKAGRQGKMSVYYTDTMERQRLCLLFQAAPERAEELWEQMPEGTDAELLLAAAAMYQKAQYRHCAVLLEAVTERTGRWYLLRGKAAMQEKSYPDAARLLRKAEPEYPKQTAPLLEQCCRELGDFKGAYEYALKQRDELHK